MALEWIFHALCDVLSLCDPASYAIRSPVPHWRMKRFLRLPRLPCLLCYKQRINHSLTSTLHSRSSEAVSSIIPHYKRRNRSLCVPAFQNLWVIPTVCSRCLSSKSITPRSVKPFGASKNLVAVPTHYLERLCIMVDLDIYSKQLEGFRASDEARERLVSVRFLSRA
jgi:hypothetical protein